jgi:hypothetical protein
MSQNESDETRPEGSQKLEGRKHQLSKQA